MHSQCLCWQHREEADRQSQSARHVALWWSAAVSPGTYMTWAIIRINTYINMLSVHVSWRRWAPRMWRKRLWMRGGLRWSTLQLTRLLEQSSSGRLQMWRAPGGLSRHVPPPITTYPQSGRKDGEWYRCWLEYITDGKERRWLHASECIVSHFWEEKMGNVGTVNDLCVFPLRAQTWFCFSALQCK